MKIQNTISINTESKKGFSTDIIFGDKKARVDVFCIKNEQGKYQLYSFLIGCQSFFITSPSTQAEFEGKIKKNEESEKLLAIAFEDSYFEIKITDEGVLIDLWEIESGEIGDIIDGVYAFENEIFENEDEDDN